MWRLLVLVAITARASLAYAQPSPELTSEFQAGVDAFRLGQYDAAKQHLDGDRPAYYWFFQDESVDDFHPIERCPSCRGVLRGYDGEGLFPQLVCDDCKILTSG